MRAMGHAARTYDELDEVEHDHDHVVTFRDASWADYRRLVALRGDAPVPRFAYLEGTIEIVSPSRAHESLKSMIGRLVEAWCVERGVEVTPYGSWLLENKRKKGAIEPDECYVVGDRPEDVARPDLAIEVIKTSGGLKKLEIYQRLGVREVWYWQKGALVLFALRGEAYEEITSSEVLPGIDHAALLGFVDMRPMTRAVRAYVRSLRGEKD